MIRPYALTVLMLCICFALFAQNPIALDYNSLQLREEFSDQNENWTYMTTVENLYMPDNGDLFMHRNNVSSAYAFVTKWKNDLKVFNILAKMKLGPAEVADQSIGIICLAQRDGKGAIVVEFNKFKQYRIKQLIGAYYRNITGTPEEQGWVKSNLLNAREDYNELDIRVALPQIDVYINKKLAKSFDVADYEAGEMGLLVGPNTKAKADFFYVYSTNEELGELDSRKEKQQEKMSLSELLAKQRYETEQKDRSLKECQSERQKAVSVLEDEVGRLTAENERMIMQNKQLVEFRDQVLIDIDEDAFLTLAENLKNEIIKNERLESQVQVYRDSLKLTHANYNKLKLVLLDKSIKKAEKEKVEREAKEALTTKKEIEAELLDKKLTKEQQEWEKKNYKPTKAVIPTPGTKTEPATPAEAAKPKAEPKPTPVAASPKAEEKTTSTSKPLPVAVKPAKIKAD